MSSRRVDFRTPRPESFTGAEVRAMFSRVSGGYDRLNRVLSLRLDEGWRRAAVGVGRPGPEDRVLDVCAGTGDLALAFARAGAGSVVATDFCVDMLRFLPAKAHQEGVSDRLGIGAADCLRLPFGASRFDVVSNAFGIRNVTDPAAGVAEMARVLAPGGRLVLLEFDYPRAFAVRAGYEAYRVAITWIARLLSRSNEDAYRYLNGSVRRFAEEVDLAGCCRGAGLEDVERRALTFGIVQLVSARRAPSTEDER